MKAALGSAIDEAVPGDAGAEATGVKLRGGI